MYRLLYVLAGGAALFALTGLSVLPGDFRKPNGGVTADIILILIFGGITFLSFRSALRRGAKRKAIVAFPHQQPQAEAHSQGFFARMSERIENARREAEARREAQQRQLAERVARQVRELENIRTGQLAPVCSCQSILQKGESAYMTTSASLLETKTTRYAGRSAGVSFRVAKGVTLRTGSYGGHAVKELVETAQGELAVTNRRLLFAGNAKSRATKLNKIVSIERFNDGIVIHEDNKSSLYRTGAGHRLDLFEALTRRLAAEVE
jgi:hypothetical protein